MILTLDFETHGIEEYPNYPPYPIGVAMKWDSDSAVYHSWGHVNGGNTTTFENGRERVRDAVVKVVSEGGHLLCHNTKFELSVMSKWFRIPLLAPTYLYDTMIEAPIVDPYIGKIGLKQLAHIHLGLPPDERDEVGDWLVSRYRTSDGKAMTLGNGDNTFMKYLHLAPPELVGKYAIGDVDRTYLLHNNLIKQIELRGMMGVYNRELALLPLLVENEMRGIRVDMERLGEALATTERELSDVGGIIHDRIGIDPDDLNKSALLVEKLAAAGLVDVDKLLKTGKTGAPSTSMDSLRLGLKDPAWVDLFQHRSKLEKFCSTYLRPWHRMAAATGGLMHTRWNQVVSDQGGARTGRFSSSPNFQNIPRVPKADPIEIFGRSWLPLPNLRGLIVPWDKDWILIDRDYSQQELRILAHLGEGPTMEEYQRNPWFDIHQWTQTMLKAEHGIDIAREPVKTLNFRIIYGGGAPAIASSLGISVDEAKELRDAVLNVNPALAMLYATVERRAAEQQPVRTLAGREFYCPEPKLIEGRWRHYAYKLVNYTIQGSAGDYTKEAWVNIGPDKDWFKMYVSVHDEFLVSVPKEYLHKGMEHLRSKMDNIIPLDVPMLTEGKWSAESWGKCIPYDKKGVLC